MKNLLLLGVLALGTSAGAQVQKWEYLTYIIRDDAEKPAITIFERGKYRIYTLAEFEAVVKKAGAKYEYENDYLDYFGSLGWELAGIEVNPPDRPYGPQHIFYFKRPVKK